MINAIKNRNAVLDTEIAELRSKVDAAKNENEVALLSDRISLRESEKAINEARLVELAERSQGAFAMTNKTANKDMQGVKEFRSSIENLRGVNVSTISDAAPIIPTVIQTEIVKKIETYGNLLKLIKKTTKKGYQRFPRYEGKATAEWQEDDGSFNATRQALEALGDVTLDMFILSAHVAYSELSDLVSDEEWVNLFADEAAKAVVMKLEAASISGDGNKKLTGITIDENVASVSLTDEQINNADTWITLTADLDEAYQNGTYVLNYGSFINMKTLKDEAGHYVGFVGENGGKHIVDKNAVTVSGSLLKPFKTAQSGDVIAVYGDFNDYNINFQRDIIVERRFDHEKRQWVIDVVAYCDGKVVDPFSFIVVKKA
jgi:HK97 family phage major capsid protein